MGKAHESDEKLLQSHPLFSPLSPEEFLKICSRKKYHLYHKNQVIFYEGTPVSGIYLLIRGKVKIHKHGVLGRDQIVRMTRDGDVLTYRAVGGSERYAVSATAMEDSERLSRAAIPREGTMSRLKHLGERLAARDPARQVADIEIRYAVLNTFNTLGMLDTIGFA